MSAQLEEAFTCHSNVFTVVYSIFHIPNGLIYRSTLYSHSFYRVSQQHPKLHAQHIADWAIISREYKFILVSRITFRIKIRSNIHI